MKLSKLSKAQVWGSRLIAKTNKFKRIELNTPEDVNQLMVNDTVFVKGDDIADDIGNALKQRASELNADLIDKPTKNKLITKFWIAPELS